MQRLRISCPDSFVLGCVEPSEGETDPPQGATMHSWGVPLLRMELGQQSAGRQQRAQKPTAEQTVEDS